MEAWVSRNSDIDVAITSIPNLSTTCLASAVLRQTNWATQYFHLEGSTLDVQKFAREEVESLRNAFPLLSRQRSDATATN
jgi:hypothetical protein